MLPWLCACSISFGRQTNARTVGTFHPGINDQRYMQSFHCITHNTSIYLSLRRQRLSSWSSSSSHHLYFSPLMLFFHRKWQNKRKRQTLLRIHILNTYCDFCFVFCFVASFAHVLCCVQRNQRIAERKTTVLLFFLSSIAIVFGYSAIDLALMMLLVVDCDRDARACLCARRRHIHSCARKGKWQKMKMTRRVEHSETLIHY